MTTYLVKLPTALAARIQAEPDLLAQVWRKEDVVDDDVARLNQGEDRLMEDYLGLARELEESPGRYRWMRAALEGTGAEIEFEYGYGDGFVLTAGEGGDVAVGLVGEGWWSPGQDVETIAHAVAAFYDAAARENRVVIGGIG
jgi:hypothetical protein